MEKITPMIALKTQNINTTFLSAEEGAMKPDTVHELREAQYGFRYNWRGGGHIKECIFEDLSMQLPTEASLAGMTLTFELPPQDDDPIYLKDRSGKILCEWETVPSLTEVRETALRYLAKIQ
jgi:hypothetical protein